MKKNNIIDLKKLNLSFEDRNTTIKLITLKKTTMNLDVEVYEKNKFIKNSIIAFAHLPKKLKTKINPISK